MRQRLAAGRPRTIGVVWHVLSGEDEAPPVPRHALAEPFGPRLRSDQNEQAVRGDSAPCVGLPVLQYQRLEMIGAGAAGHLYAVGDLDVRHRVDLADQV